MATDLETLKSIRRRILDRLDSLTRKPNTSGADTADHVGEKNSLWGELREVDERIASIEGGFEILTEGTT